MKSELEYEISEKLMIEVRSLPTRLCLQLCWRCYLVVGVGFGASLLLVLLLFCC